MIGTSHIRSGLPCQDSCLADVAPTEDGTVAILVCADGAGSAAYSNIGAQIACEAVAKSVRSDLCEGQTVTGIERDSVLFWVERTREFLHDEANRRKVSPRELACTLVLAVVGEAGAAFAQIGDGAIVLWDEQSYQPVFWPQPGEYANTTDFLTDSDYSRRLSFERRPGRFDELALLTDGLQRLALDYEAKSGHRPFFHPLFRSLRNAKVVDALAEQLREFLDSPRINQRSDDDKTLILATRVPPSVDATDAG
jgi:hypothetical protein